MAVVYATADDFADYTGQDPPPDIARRLERASERIDELLASAVYAVDDATQLPTQPQVAEALMRATCAQAAWTLAVGDEHGVAAAYGEVAIGSVRLKRAGASDASPVRYAPDAAAILRRAGLLPGYIIDYGAWR